MKNNMSVKEKLEELSSDLYKTEIVYSELNKKNTYGIINRETGVVEFEHVQFPIICQVFNDLNDYLEGALNYVEEEEEPSEEDKKKENVIKLH